MCKITQKEAIAVQGIEGIYYSLRTSAEQVARTLFYDYPISFSNKASSGLFNKLFNQNNQVTKKDLMALLEVLTILQADFEDCMPLIVEDKLYFKFRNLDGRKRDNNVFKTGEATNGYDLPACFQALEERISETLAIPEVSRVASNSKFFPYCACLSKKNLGINSLHKSYLIALTEQEEAETSNPISAEAPLHECKRRHNAVHKPRKNKKVRRIARRK